MTRRSFLTMLAVLLMCCAAGLRGAETRPVVFIAGSETDETRMLTRKLSERFDVVRVDDPAAIDARRGKLLYIVSDKALPAAYRMPVDRFMRAAGNVVLIGREALYYSPYYVHPPSALTTFDNDYTIVWPRRTKPPGSVDTPQVKPIEHDGKKGVEIASEKRGMRDVMVAVPLAGKTTPTRNVIAFEARGSHFMDLLALEIRDKKGGMWYSFVPLSRDWERHSVSLADFIPAGWSDPDNLYPLLDPAQADTLLLGLNTMTTWFEKPMGFALVNLQLAENKIEYTPSSSLGRLRNPFAQIGIAAPAWMFDPCDRGIASSGEFVLKSNDYFSPAPVDIKTWDFTIAEPRYEEHPASATGSDTRQSKVNKEGRLMRSETFLWGRKYPAGAFIQYARGRYRGGSLTFVGLTPAKALGDPGLTEHLVSAADVILNKPRILGVSINTTRFEEGKPIVPVILADLVNPRGRIAKGTLTVDLGGLKRTIDLALAAGAVKQYAVELPEVPADFPFTDFAWEVRFETNDSRDVVRDSVDVERAMIRAFNHLTYSQSMYPDGRISNHYFGDAYGVRAMFAYLDYLKKNPASVRKLEEVWRGMSPKKRLLECAERFFDMLADRQEAHGGWPMGYGEHSRVYNVADGGQMAISILQSLRNVPDPARRERYLASAVRFGHWAENYYIDESLSAKLKTEEPKEYAKGNARAGFYGLGPAGGRERRTGPSWVLSDVLAAQIALAHAAPEPDRARFRAIADRNADFYTRLRTTAKGYYQAEALCWIYFDTKNDKLKSIIRENLAETFIKPLSQGVELDMHELGGRATLKALPLLYTRRILGDDAAKRAILLKYVWSFGSESYTHSMKQLSENMPRPVHGEALATAKYAALSAIWCMELLSPGSTLIGF